MVNKLSILIEKRVMMVRVIGDATIAEIADASLNVAEFLNTVAENESGIIMFDNTKTITTPTNGNEIRKATSPYTSHPRHGHSVFFGLHRGEKPILNYMLNLGSRLLKQPFVNCDSESDAVKFIISQYPDLAESLPKALKEYRAKEG